MTQDISKKAYGEALLTDFTRSVVFDRQFSLVEETKVETEQRKFIRLLPRDLTFAVIRPHFSNLGKVKDISKGGMAYEYILNETKNTGYAEIDIFLSSYSFYLPRIPSTIIYDTKKVDEKFQSLETRRCGVQFGDLTKEQAANLDFLIKNHTKTTA